MTMFKKSPQKAKGQPPSSRTITPGAKSKKHRGVLHTPGMTPRQVSALKRKIQASIVAFVRRGP
jgi:hypothetical protein